MFTSSRRAVDVVVGLEDGHGGVVLREADYQAGLTARDIAEYLRHVNPALTQSV